MCKNNATQVSLIVLQKKNKCMNTISLRKIEASKVFGQQERTSGVSRLSGESKSKSNISKNHKMKKQISENQNDTILNWHKSLPSLEGNKIILSQLILYQF